jgi:alpha-beta hydrolase superfamily lysophospholipase
MAVPEGVTRKGIVFYIHGFGAYCERSAYIFNVFAENGYEIIAFD